MKHLALALFLFVVYTISYADEGRYVEYVLKNQTYEGYFISPDKNAPLVLIVQDWDGITDYEIKRAKMLNDLGYQVFLIDMYKKGVRPALIEDKKRLTTELYKDRNEMRKRVLAGVKKGIKLAGTPQNSVIIGYCFGGSVVMELARSGYPLKGFISFHGGLSTPDGQDYSRTSGDVVIFHGGADAAVPLKDLVLLAEDLEKYKVTYDMHIFSGAPHAFTVFDSPNYRQHADEKSWEIFLGYLRKNFKK